ncbi:hypothetical protein F2Q69_00054940 [Brassica cretica]|uniref:Uncharacterized protein n=1 Tax=Brassica cretica TaxID=69181 RepID=A0A8S9MUK4_BRACR|nr:hypothetical protein F2Q69_00054940 [Brassica cretica]
MVPEHQGLDLGVSTLHLNFSQSPSVISRLAKLSPFGWHKSKEQVREPNEEEEESESSNDESNDVKVLDTSYIACGVGAINDGNVSHFFGDRTCHMASLDDFWIG